MLTLSERFDDESEAEKRKEDAIELLEAGEDAAVTLEATEETLDFLNRRPGSFAKARPANPQSSANW